MTCNQIIDNLSRVIATANRDNFGALHGISKHLPVYPGKYQLYQQSQRCYGSLPKK